MKRGDLFRAEETGRELEERLLAAVMESDESTFAAKSEFATAMWEAECNREETLRSKGERMLPLPTLILSTLLGGGIVALVNSWVSTPWAHALLWAVLLAVLLSGLTAIWYGYKTLDVRQGQAINPGLAIEKHDKTDSWHAVAAAHYLAKYKSDLKRKEELAFHVRLCKEWTLATVVVGIIGASLTTVVWVSETGGAPAGLDAVGVAAGLLVWAWLYWRLVRKPKPHK